MIKDNFILKINTKNLIKNYYFFKKRKENLLVGSTIKSNAYGLGFRKIYELLLNNGCKHFFVATLEEGIKINNKRKGIFIYVLNGIQNYDLKLFNQYNLTPIINTRMELKRITKSKLKFGLHIDTGINRLGINYDNIPSHIFNNKNITILISHLSSADEQKNAYNTG